jgi:acetoin utilization deacetylase AcuC-like enzyme
MMRMTMEGFAQLARLVQSAAERLCGGRMALVLEGGYNLEALGASVVAVVRALDAPT